jgi:hypothetical protein
MGGPWSPKQGRGPVAIKARHARRIRGKKSIMGSLKMIICTELGQGGHELLTLLSAHASKHMDCSTGVEPADQSCLGKIYQCGGNREIPRFRPTALDIAQAPPRLPLRISEILPATAPRAARGRADAAEAAGCTVVATAKLAPLSFKIYPPPPPFPIQQHVQREENQALGQPRRLC